MYYILYLFNKAVDIYLLLILIRVLISWVAPHSRNEFTILVHKLTDPLLERCRVLIPLGRSYMDLSPIIAYYVVKIASFVIRKILISLF